MKFAKTQLLLTKSILSDMDPLVSQELSRLLQVVTSTSCDRATLYEQWEEKSPHVRMFGDDQTCPISKILMDIFNQGRVSDLLASLERLLDFGIKPTFEEFAKCTQELLKSPWLLSRPELEVLKVLLVDPTASVSRISQITDYHRQTVASYLRRLHFALQISTYPIINYHALGLRRLQFWFRGTAEVPDSLYFYSRLSLAGTNYRKGWLVDTWSVPEGAKDILLERYQKLEHSREVYDLSVRELLSFGKHLSLSTYEQDMGWLSYPDVVKLVYERALAGQDSHVPQLLEVMVYAKTKSHKADAIDIKIIEGLWKDYLLGQTRDGAAIQLGISRSTFNRRLKHLESTGVIKPSLWLKTENMVQTALTIPIDETPVLNALTCLPVIYYYLNESMEGKYWFVVANSSPAEANVIIDSSSGDKKGPQSYPLKVVDQKNGIRLFKAFDRKVNCWNQDLLINSYNLEGREGEEITKAQVY